MTSAVTAVQTMPSGLWCGWNPMIEDDGALDAQVDGQTDEGDPDQAHRPVLPFLVYVGQFPQDNDGGPDLDQAVKAESRKSDGSGLHGGKRQHEHTDDVPAQRGRFQLATPPEKPSMTSPVGNLGHWRVSQTAPLILDNDAP